MHWGNKSIDHAQADRRLENEPLQATGSVGDTIFDLKMVSNYQVSAHRWVFVQWGVG